MRNYTVQAQLGNMFEDVVVKARDPQDAIKKAKFILKKYSSK